MSEETLLCMDFQNDIVNPEGEMGRGGLAAAVEKRGVADNVGKMRKLANDLAWGVAHVRVAYRADYMDSTSVSKRFQSLRAANALVEGTWGSSFDERFAPNPDEMVFTKRAVNPFFGTGLLAWLAGRGSRHVVLCGVATNMVVESAARYADDAGLEVTVIEDACASFRDDWHQFSVENILPMLGRVVSTEEVVKGGVKRGKSS